VIRYVLPFVALLAANATAAQTPPARPGFSLGAPLLLPPESPLVRPGRARPEQSLAPLPNRDIEAPPTFGATDPRLPSLEPTLLAPTDRYQGTTFGREHAPDRERERLFETVVPGARLRIPIE
jgi:hypothetical protein